MPVAEAMRRMNDATTVAAMINSLGSLNAVDDIAATQASTSCWRCKRHLHGSGRGQLVRP